MKRTVQYVTERGINEIATFLAENHTRGANYFTKDMLRAWADEADYKLQDGEAPTIEIKSFDSIHGRNQTFTVSKDGLGFTEIDDGHH